MKRTPAYPKKSAAPGHPSDFEITGSATEIKTYCDISMGFLYGSAYAVGEAVIILNRYMTPQLRHNAILTEGGFCSINQHFKNKA